MRSKRPEGGGSSACDNCVTLSQSACPPDLLVLFWEVGLPSSSRAGLVAGLVSRAGDRAGVRQACLLSAPAQVKGNFHAAVKSCDTHGSALEF